MKRSRIRELVLDLACVALALSILWILIASPAGPGSRGVSPFLTQETESRSLFEGSLRRIHSDHVDQHESAELLRAAMEGMLSVLDDPYATMLSPDQFQSLGEAIDGAYSGIGVSIGVRDEHISVHSILPGSLARQGGLYPGDRILAVEGENARGWTTQQAAERLKGPESSRVRLTVSHVSDDRPRDIEVQRRKIDAQSVSAVTMLENGTGYIDITSFAAPTAGLVAEAIDELSSQGMTLLILDLRSNGGGLLRSSEEIANLFLPTGSTIATLRRRPSEPVRTILATRPPKVTGLPIAILVGPNTASASEVLAGALRDNDAAVIVGSRTYGKGSVQTVFPLPGDHGLRMTTGRWYTPSGRSIQARGGEGTGVFRTVSGRVIPGDTLGGIVPDVVTTRNPQLAVVGLRSHYGDEWPEFNNHLLDYGARFALDTPGVQNPVTIHQSDLDDFAEVLVEQELPLPAPLSPEIREWLLSEMEAAITLAAWGEEQVRIRHLDKDPEVRIALDILGLVSERIPLMDALAERSPSP